MNETFDSIMEDGLFEDAGRETVVSVSFEHTGSGPMGGLDAVAAFHTVGDAMGDVAIAVNDCRADESMDILEQDLFAA